MKEDASCKVNVTRCFQSHHLVLSHRCVCGVEESQTLELPHSHIHVCLDDHASAACVVAFQPKDAHQGAR